MAFEAEAARTTLPGIQGLPRDVIEWAYDRYIQDGVFPINGGLTTSALGTTFQIAKETGDLTRIPAPDEVALLQIQDDVLARIGRR